MGADLVSLRMASGHVDKIGVFFAYAQAAGDLSALAVGRQQSVGHERINGYGVGGYWTHVGPSGWYVDSVLTGLWFDGNATSDFGTGINTSRNSLVASVEGGIRFLIAAIFRLGLMPSSFASISLSGPEQDAISTGGFDTPEGFTGRIGLQMQGSLQKGKMLWQPYLKLNLWYGFEEKTKFFWVVPIASSASIGLPLGKPAAGL